MYMVDKRNTALGEARVGIALISYYSPWGVFVEPSNRQNVTEETLM